MDGLAYRSRSDDARLRHVPRLPRIAILSQRRHRRRDAERGCDHGSWRDSRYFDPCGDGRPGEAKRDGAFHESRRCRLRQSAEPRKSRGHQRLAGGGQCHYLLGILHLHVQISALLAATELKKANPALGGQVVFNLVDGAVRLILFLLFIWGVSLFPDIRRVYEYHGAEHKTVFAFENGDPLETAAVQKYSTFHPRCGTSFLMTVMLISIGFYMLVPFTTFWARFASRIALLPLIAGVSYEIIRFAAKHRGSLFALMTAPGLWLQRITTQPPSDEMAVCAITALEEAMTLEKENGGELVIA